MRIWKYKLDIVAEQTVALPYDSRILSVHNQNDNICVWVAVPLEVVMTISRSFYIVPTGEAMPNKDIKFLDTVQIGSFVWHVFVGE